MSQYFKTKWPFIERLLRLLEVIAIIVGVIFSVVQLRDIRNMQSAQLMLAFNNDLSSKTNLEITTAIEDNKPIFQNSGGTFTATDIDNYLGTYELINSVHEAGLITNDMLYSAFSYDIVKTYENNEIKSYLENIRKEDETFFVGFEEMAKALQKIK